MEGEEYIHRKRGWIATIITFVILVLIALFVMRVIYYADLIRSGGIDASSLDFSNNLSLSTKLANSTITNGEYDLVTSDDPSLGLFSAPVTIVEFADFGCTYSRESSFVVRELASKYPDSIRFIYRDFPLTDLHPISLSSAEAGECAQEQGRFWEFHDKMYQNQLGLSESRFIDFARELNMNITQFESCLASDRYSDEIIEDYQAGVEAGVQGTPTFFINGNRVAGSIPAQVFDSVIQALINTQAQ